MSVPHTIRTWLTERLGLRYPIVQAPMAGGPTTPQLVAAVGNAGALGSFGFAYTEPAAMQQQVEAARARSTQSADPHQPVRRRRPAAAFRARTRRPP